MLFHVETELSEMWKATNFQTYPTQFNRQDSTQGHAATRACTMGRLIEEGVKPTTLKTFKSDASRLWNSAPREIKESKTLNAAKKAIKIYVKTLPV